jgi:hypothetical protein
MRRRVVYVRTQTKGLSALLTRFIAERALKAEGWRQKGDVVRIGRSHLDLLLVLLCAHERHVRGIAGTLKSMERSS